MGCVSLTLITKKKTKNRSACHSVLRYENIFSQKTKHLLNLNTYSLLEGLKLLKEIKLKLLHCEDDFIITIQTIFIFTPQE